MLKIKLSNNLEGQKRPENSFRGGVKTSPASVSFLGRLLKPLIKEEDVLRIFKDEIVPIPRASGHCEKISAYLSQELEKCGFQVEIQQSGTGKGNIFATRNVKPGDKNAIVLQAHMDMVYVAKAKKGQKPDVVPVVSGNYLMAKNTSLGADDGIGLALALAIARIEDPKIKNIPLQIVFTVDEEEGLIGVQDIPSDAIKGKYLINFDNGNPDKLIVGCAGLVDFDFTEQYPEVALGKVSNAGYVKMSVAISGAQGGHSALTINRGRMNPVVSLLKLVKESPEDMKIMQFKGGNEINSIPKSATIELLVPAEKVSTVYQQLRDGFDDLKEGYQKTDPGVKLDITVSSKPVKPETKVMASGFQEALLDALTEDFRQGVVFQEENSRRPTTSENIGKLELVNGKITVKARIRSNDKQRQQDESAYTRQLFSRLLGKEIKPANETPVWEQKEDAFSRLAAKSYEEIFDKLPIFSNTHGSVEGAILNQYVEDVVGVGPAIKSMHTPAERLFIPSLGPVCDFVETLIRNIHNKLLGKSRVQANDI